MNEVDAGAGGGASSGDGTGELDVGCARGYIGMTDADDDLDEMTMLGDSIGGHDEAEREVGSMDGTALCDTRWRRVEWEARGGPVAR